MPDLVNIDTGHGIAMSEYHRLFVLVFYLTSTKALHDFIQPLLNNCSISNKLRFPDSLLCNVEIFIKGEKASNIFMNCSAEFHFIILSQTDG